MVIQFLHLVAVHGSLVRGAARHLSVKRIFGRGSHSGIIVGEGGGGREALEFSWIGLSVFLLSP